MPGRLGRREFWVRWRGEIGYAIGTVAVVVALVGQHQNTDAIRDQSHRLAVSQRVITRQQEVIRQQARLGAQTHTAVCTLRRDYIQRVAQSEQFLAEHPEGFAGVTAEAIQASITSQRHTIKALASLRCS